MQAFVVITARCIDGRPEIDPPYVFFDRQAAYRHYRDGGGKVPTGHGLERLEAKSHGRGDLTVLEVVDIPDRQRYDRQFILQLVRRILDGELSQSEASRLYGPSQSRISEWVRTHRDEALEMP